ncbi:MAG: hypothetical protein GYA17_03630 [Chloroflexi bacterium]|jgi:hypothetical protein|nr:hypothetical protein [Anaerolineaceae bacterium]NMB87425.1 hypothetical protein [Chloroflexota bacterium]
MPESKQKKVHKRNGVRARLAAAAQALLNALDTLAGGRPVRPVPVPVPVENRRITRR